VPGRRGERERGLWVVVGVVGRVGYGLCCAGECGGEEMCGFGCVGLV
jgi:hypothetical protein